MLTERLYKATAHTRHLALFLFVCCLFCLYFVCKNLIHTKNTNKKMFYISIYGTLVPTYAHTHRRVSFYSEGASAHVHRQIDDKRRLSYMCLRRRLSWCDIEIDFECKQWVCVCVCVEESRKLILFVDFFEMIFINY